MQEHILKVRIVRSNDDNWYKDQIGAEVFVENDDDKYYVMEGLSGTIAKADCEIIGCGRKDCAYYCDVVKYHCDLDKWKPKDCLNNNFKHFELTEKQGCDKRDCEHFNDSLADHYRHTRNKCVQNNFKHFESKLPPSSKQIDDAMDRVMQVQKKVRYILYGNGKFYNNNNFPLSGGPLYKQKALCDPETRKVYIDVEE